MAPKTGRDFLLLLNSPASSPPSSDPLTLLTPAQAIARDYIVGKFTSRWVPTDWNSIVWQDTIIPTSVSQLNTWINGRATMISGAVCDPTRNQKIVIPASGFSYDADMSLRGLATLAQASWAANGKVLGLTCENGKSQPFLKRVNVYGVIGLYIYDFGFTMGVTESGGDPNWCPQVNSITLVSGGTGYVTGDEVKIAVATSGKVYFEPKFTVTASAGVITNLVIKAGDPKNAGGISGVITAAALTTVTGSGSGATATVDNGSSPRDYNQLVLTRNSASPLLYKVRVENCNFGYGHRGATQKNQPWEFISGPRCYAGEQFDLINCIFDGYENGMNIGSCRLFYKSGNDFQRGSSDNRIATNTQWTSTQAGTSSLASYYPAEPYMYIWDRLNTDRNVVDQSDLVGPSGNYIGFYLAHSDFAQTGTANTGDEAGIYHLNEFNVGYRERQTELMTDRGSALAGGTQGIWTRGGNASFAYPSVFFNNAIACNSLNNHVLWSGNSDVAYCTALRVGHLALSAGDDNPSVLSRKGTSNPTVYTHSVNNCVYGALLAPAGGDTATGQVAPVDQGGNIVADPTGGLAGSDYPATFPALTGAGQDAGGRFTYTFTDDGVESPAAFRARMFSTFGKSGAGFTDPAGWPTA